MWEFTADLSSKLTLMYKDDKILLIFTITGFVLLLKLVYKTLAFLNSYILRLFLPLNLFSKYGNSPKPSSNPKTNTFALITGSSKGIGAKLAFCLASQGFNLILIARTTELLNKLKLELQNKHKVDVIVFTCDFTQITHPQLWDSINLVVKNKDIGIFINNAAICFYNPVQTMTLGKIHHILNLNLKGYFMLTQIMLPLLIRGCKEGRDGKGNSAAVVNVASIVGERGFEFFHYYTTTKRFVIEMSLEFGKELKKTVNRERMKIDTLVVTPALVSTNMSPISLPGFAISAENAAWKIVKQIGRTHRTYGHFSHYLNSLIFLLPFSHHLHPLFGKFTFSNYFQNYLKRARKYKYD
jgi:short-subunit dehydrogenase